MSAVASSFEVTHTPEMLAGEVEWRFRNMATHLPLEVKLAPVDRRVLLAEIQDVGRLETQYLGSFALCIEAEFDGYGGALIGKDFDLTYGESGGTPVAREEHRVTADDFTGHSIEMLTDIACRLERLHAAFVEARYAEPAPVFNILDGTRL